MSHTEADYPAPYSRSTGHFSWPFVSATHGPGTCPATELWPDFCPCPIGLQLSLMQFLKTTTLPRLTCHLSSYLFFLFPFASACLILKLMAMTLSNSDDSDDNDKSFLLLIIYYMPDTVLSTFHISSHLFHSKFMKSYPIL